MELFPPGDEGFQDRAETQKVIEPRRLLNEHIGAEALALEFVPWSVGRAEHHNGRLSDRSRMNVRQHLQSRALWKTQVHDYEVRVLTALLAQVVEEGDRLLAIGEHQHFARDLMQVERFADEEHVAGVIFYKNNRSVAGGRLARPAAGGW